MREGIVPRSRADGDRIPPTISAALDLVERISEQLAAQAGGGADKRTRARGARPPAITTLDLVDRMDGDVLLPLPVVSEITSLSEPTIKKWVKEGKFPPSVHLSDKEGQDATPAVAWSAREVFAWVQARKDKRA